MTAAEIATVVGNVLGPILTGAAGWLTARATYRTAAATAKATVTGAKVQAAATERQEAREDHKEAVSEWQAIADRYKGELDTLRDQAKAELDGYRTEAHAKLGKAHDAVIGLLGEKVSLTDKVARLEERVRACDDDRAKLHEQLDKLSTAHDELTSRCDRLEKGEKVTP